MFPQKLQRVRKWLIAMLLISVATVLMKNVSDLNFLSATVFGTERNVKHAKAVESVMFASSKQKESLQIQNESRKTLETELYNTSKPVMHVRFLKVHKSGSSTIQNMLFRFALRNNLTILLPKYGNHIMSKAEAVPLSKPKRFDIFAIHTVYEKRWFDSLLPNDSVNIAIVRDPLDRFISAAFYHRDVFNATYLKRVPSVNYIHNLVQHPERYERNAFSLTKNTMARDFGFSPRLTPIHKDNINRYLNFLDNEFMFVLIMEYFEESLVLLRRLMNWSLIDIIHLPVNSHKHSNVKLTPSEISKLKQTCFLDYAVYDFFLQLFKTRLENEGQRFYEEVTHFKTILANVESFCNANKSQSLLIEASQWNDVFVLPREECTLMTWPEDPLIDALRRRHYAIFAQK